MVAAESMGAVYWKLLRKLEHGRFDVFGEAPVRLNRWQKTGLLVRTWLRLRAGLVTPNYGVP